MSQPGREFLCKITELGMFAGDFVLGHVILFMMLPLILIPKIDTVHSVMLFWLRPSRQIRPPIYSMKQSKLRKRRVWRYAVLYFIILIVFLALVVGPIVAGKNLISDSLINSIPMELFQPSLKNNDTRNRTETGTGAKSGAGASKTGGSGFGKATAKVKLY